MTREEIKETREAYLFIALIIKNLPPIDSIKYPNSEKDMKRRLELIDRIITEREKTESL
jgi:hypothetical protein